MKKMILLFLFAILTPLYSNWNRDFDKETEALSNAFVQFQGEYIARHEEFFRVRELLLRDSELQRQMLSTLEKDKFLLLRNKEGVILKKRAKQNINELFVWELSHFLDAEEFFVPSFPVEIGDKKVIVQQLESFVVGDKKTRLPPKRMMHQVSLVDYWKTHLSAYLLGLQGLEGRNIGIAKRGQLRFFDIEKAFHYRNADERSGVGIEIGFISQGFDWPHCHMPLDKNQAKAIAEFIEGLSSFEENLSVYRQYRSLNFNEKGLRYRLERVRTFQVEEGQSFYDFYAFLNPILIYCLDDIQDVVEAVIGREAGLGSVLFFLREGVHKYEMSSSKRKKLSRWLDVYEQLYNESFMQ